MRPARAHPLWLAYLLHRLSGLALALFLPLHFLVLASVLRGEATLDSLLAFTANPVVKLMEMGLVFLLAVHLTGGLRLLALEFLPWRPAQKTLAAAAIGVSAFVAGAFVMQVV